MAKELAIGLVIGAALSGGFKATISSAQKTVKKLGDGLSQSYQTQSRLGERLQRAQQKQLALQQRISLAYANGDKGVDRLVRRYERMQRAIGQVVVKQQQFTTAIQRAEQAQKTLQATIEKQQARKLQRDELSGSVMKSSAAATAIALPVWSTIKTFAEQEESANNLKIAMMKADGTFGAFDEISKIAGELGNTLPGTRKDFYDLTRALKMQGISDDTLKKGGLATSAKLNVLLDMDQMAGGEFFAKMLESHGLSEAEMGVAADDLQRAMFAAGMNKEQMYGAMAYYASNVRSMKLTGRENTRKLFAIEGLAAQQGMEGTSFGTGFSTMLDRMNKGPKMLAEAKKGMKAEAAELMDKSGVKFNFWDKKGNFKGIDAMITELEKLDVIRKKFGDEGAGLVAEGLFGVEGKRLALLLAEKGAAGLQEFLDKMQAQASLEERVAQKTKTLSSALEALGGVWESAVGTFGSAFADDIKSFASTAQNFIEGTLTPWIEKHKSLIKWGVATAMGLASLSTAVFALRFAFSGLLSIGTAFKLPYQLIKARQAVKALNNVNQSVTLFGRLGKAFSWAGQKSLSFAKGVFSLSRMLGSKLLPAIKIVGSAISWLGKALLTNPLMLAITAIALGAYLVYQNWEPIKTFFSGLWDWVKTTFDSAWNWVSNVWSQAGTWFSGIWENIKTFFSSGISNITNTILNWSPLSLFRTVFAEVLSWFGIELPTKFGGFGQNIIDGLVDGITSAWSLAKEKVSELGNGIKSWFAEKLGIHSPSRVFMGYGENTVDGLVIGIAKSAIKASSAALGLGQAMQDAMPTKLETPHIKVNKAKVNTQTADQATAALTQEYLAPLHQAGNRATQEGVVVHFNPTIRVNSASGQGIVEQVQQGLQMSLREFEQLINRVVDQKMRRAY